MATKLGRNEVPSGHSREDFECFGPVATKDTDFAGCKLADLGCFKQDEGTDSNKYYHAAVVKSKKNGKFYLYVEYGRTKDGLPSSPQFQFTDCGSESEAMDEFVDQCNSKNTKRGIWEKVGSKERFVPKPKKGGTEDLYVVRYMISRSVGLPAAKNICNADAVVTSAPVAKTKKKATTSVDVSTRNLFKDLLGGTVKYTRSVMVGNTMPAMSAITDARDLLNDALIQVKQVGDKVSTQVADPTLKKLTYNLYGMIPKSKPHGAPESSWILSQDNIGQWQNDLDAFETALKSTNIEEVEDDDVMQGIPASVESIDLESDLGKYLANWWKTSSRRKHGHKELQIHNLWKVERHGDYSVFQKGVDSIAKEMPKAWCNERPMFYENQKQRPDLTSTERKLYHNSNTALLFHGTRAVNVAGIIRESLRFPNQLVGVVINGAMFGPGVYSADDWGKSANYCSVGSGRSMYAGHTGHIPNRRSFMFAVDVCLGNPFVAKDAYGYTKAPDGHHCVFGKAGHTSSWGSYGGLQNNEWIIYKKNQIVLKYLAELSWY
jgi:hypothetical protein